ncbi:NAD(P)/FAD-dependent oxidoreductase [Deinococcus radiopugnans]
METRAETVIIGGGIAGCSIAYHLAGRGYTDVLVLDRGKISAPLGSTGHAPGLLGRNSSSPTMSALASATARLFARIPQDQPALRPVGSVEVARDRTRMGLLAHKVERATDHGLAARLVSPQELGELVPYMDTSKLVGGIHLPDDGVLDARRALWAMRDEAAARGVSFLEETPVLAFETEGDRVIGVRTEQGVISCARVVVAVGIWGAALMQTLGLDLPLFPVQHPYVYTVPLEMLAGATQEASHPMVRDLDHVFYLREHGDRLGYGWYNHRPLTVDATHLTRADVAFPEQGFLDQVKYDLFPFLKDTP